MVDISDAAELLGKNLLLGRALDNRMGGFIIAQVMKRLHARKSRISSTVIAVNAVQEEIGGHGAKMVTHRLMPDVAVCLDVTHATDTPGIDRRIVDSMRYCESPLVLRIADPRRLGRAELQSQSSIALSVAEARTH